MANQKKTTTTAGAGPATLELEPPSELASIRSADTEGIKASHSCPSAETPKPTLSVALQPTPTSPTHDQMLWAMIRNRTQGIGFRPYQAFIDHVYQENVRNELPTISVLERELHGVDAYSILKLATEAFLLLETTRYYGYQNLGQKPQLQGKESYPYLTSRDPETGVRLAFTGDAKVGLVGAVGLEESRLGRRLCAWCSKKELESEAEGYLVKHLGQKILPYMGRILEAISATEDTFDLLGLEYHANEREPKWPIEPCLTELIWSYWHEEGMLVQAMNAVSLRFQNKRMPRGGPDPLAQLTLDPLRPLSNLLWGYIQDEPFRLTIARRAYEYEQEYGLPLLGRAVPRMRPADSRSKFLEAFNRLLYQTAVYFREASDTTVVPDGFPLLNGLKEVHLLLAEGAHNQFGDLPWTARVEMMIQEWLLARPEIKEFLRGRPMVPYKEDWMGQVDSLRKMYGWGDTPVSHFRDLGVFGEQILLSIRYGDWVDVDDEDQAKNWARYWKPELQGYLHAYRAVTGIDLAQIDRMPPDLIAIPPALLLQRRLPHRVC